MSGILAGKCSKHKIVPRTAQNQSINISNIDNTIYNIDMIYNIGI